MSTEYLTKTSVTRTLGCSRAAVEIYIKRGLLDELKLSNHMGFITKDSLERFIQSGTPVLTSDDEFDINRKKYIDELDERLNRIILEKEALIVTAKDEKDFININRRGRLAKIYSQIFDCVPSITKREREIALNVVRGKTFRNAVDDKSVSKDHVYQVWSIIHRKLKELPKEICYLREENQRLRERCDKQHKQIKALNDVAQTDREMKSLITMLKRERVRMSELSIRASNILFSIGVSSLYELLSVAPKELENKRNCGIKSLREILQYIDNEAKRLNVDIFPGMFHNKYK